MLYSLLDMKEALMDALVLLILSILFLLLFLIGWWCGRELKRDDS